MVENKKGNFSVLNLNLKAILSRVLTKEMSRFSENCLELLKRNKSPAILLKAESQAYIYRV